MKASEARKLSAGFAKSVNVDTLWDKLMERVKTVAETKGQTELIHPFNQLTTENIGRVTAAEEEALRKRLAAEGYKLKDHPDPDPGHPCSGPYTTLSW